jgi:drug/metabolite transporter (DMT)-like permease
VRAQDWIRLIILAAIWGASFVFFRVLAPVLGIFVTADSRVLIAGIALTLYLVLIKMPTHWATSPKQLTIIGLFNSAIPFVLFAYAAQHIPAAYSSILNAATPLFGVLAGAIWLHERLSGRRLLGVLLGIAGVALVANPWQRAGAFVPDKQFGFAVAACLVATLCYAINGIYVKRAAAHIPAQAVAAGSQLSSGIALLPLALATPAPLAAWTPLIIANVLGLALICSAIAYLLYFRLMKDVGPTNTLTVALIVPIFGMIWGWLFLNEAVNATMIAGCALILLGTWLTIRR